MNHILVVEDDPHNAILFRKVLERRGGFRVTVTETGDEVMQLVDARQVDLVIMDVSLQNTRYNGQPTNGVELCRLIKQTHPHSPPVILATAHAMRGDAEALLRESGADDYVPKPILDHAVFVDQVRTLMREAA